MEGSENVVEQTTNNAVASQEATSATESAQTPQLDLSSFEERMNEVAGGIGAINERFEQMQAAQTQYDPWDEETATDEQRVEQYINDMVEKRLETAFTEKLSPLEQRIALGERMSAISELESQFPTLRGDAAEKVITAAEAYAKRGVFADALHPEAIELIHLAEIGRGVVAQETPAGQTQATPLEGAGAEAPARQEPHPGDAIVAAGSTPSWVLG